MARAELTVLPDVAMQLDRLVQSGDFADQREAVEELLTIGIREHEAVAQSDPAGELDFAEEMIENTTDGDYSY